jgi:uncharacterized membrane protein
MKIKILIGLLLFLILVNLATIGSYLVMLKRGKAAEPSRRGMMTQPADAPFAEGRPLRRMSPELRKQLQDNIRALHRNTRDLRMTIHGLEAETFALMQMEPVPAERVDSLLQEIAAARLEMSRMATKNLIEARSELSPEERKLLFDALLSSRPDMPGPTGRGKNREGRRHKQRGQHQHERLPDSLRQ